MLLVGDVGGTKTNLAVFSVERGLRKPIQEETLLSGRYPDLISLLQDFLSRTNLVIDRVVLGVAGPVMGGQASITNLSWDIGERELAASLGVPVTLLNDLLAIASAVPYLEADHLCTLNQGQPVAGGAMAVIAPGTGLGEAFLVWDGAAYRAYPSEGGHSDFAPNTPLEADLWRYLHDRYGHVSVERVCSGLGLPNIYDFLRDSGQAEEPAWLAEQMAQAEDRTPVIVNAGLDAGASCLLCVRTVQVFVSILGAEAGNLALQTVATGGVYLGGGIPPRILSALRDGGFLNAFRSKGRLTDLARQIPVHVILNPGVALLGAAHHALGPGRSLV
ncbi:MAG: glucokinase [Anaerolineales bacterium]|nr:glucokinase [Anaerolineales bacterium]